MENKPPASLRQALAQCPWRLLLYIGRQRGLRLSSSITKTGLIDRLTVALADSHSLNQAVTTLSPAARAALTAIITAGGQAELRHLLPDYGPLRPPRQTPGHYGAPPPDASAAPLSPLEELRALGLLYYNRASQRLFLPPELLTNLPRPAPPAGPLPPPAPGRRITPDALLRHDLTCLLALLHQSPPRLLHKRWLSPHWLQRWGRHCAQPPDQPLSRSELQTNRRRFMHYLALQADFFSGPDADDQADTLALSPQAWRWLTLPAARQQQILWQAWLQPAAERWQRFKLPGADWLTQPAQLLTTLHSALLTTAGPFQPQSWSNNLIGQHLPLRDLLPAGSLHPTHRLRIALTALLTGPLQWLGLIEPASGADPTATPHLQITPVGRACLANNPAQFQVDDPPPAGSYHLTSQKLTQPLQATLTLTPTPARLPQPAHLFTALTAGRLSQPPGRATAPTSPDGGQVIITASTFVAALHRGQSSVELVQALNQLAQPPLAPAEYHLLSQWTTLANQVTIRPALLLETDQPDIITRLAGARRGRAAIQRTHSARLAEIDPARLPSLLRQLTAQQGVPPRVITGAAQPDPFSPARLNGPAQWWVAARVYQALSRLIPLPLRLDSGQLEQLEAHLTPPQLAAAETAVAQTLAALTQLIDGWANYGPWPNPGLPEETSQAVINQALQNGHWLQITYFAASSNRLTQRRVEPYRLEWRGDIPYLVGFCQQAQAERIFRLDRIQQI